MGWGKSRGRAFERRSLNMLQESPFDKTQELAITNDDVVQNLDAENFATFLETSGNGDIFLAGCRVTCRVIV